jgi:hypothetical protein
MQVQFNRTQALGSKQTVLQDRELGKQVGDLVRPGHPDADRERAPEVYTIVGRQDTHARGPESQIGGMTERRQPRVAQE